MNEQKKRSNARFPIKMQVKITCEPFGTRQMVTENFSNGGIFVRDPVIAQLKQDQKITVQSDEGIPNAPILKARIAWRDSQGAGIEYLLDAERD